MLNDQSKNFPNAKQMRHYGNFMVQLLHNSWDGFYNTIIKNARIIRDSGLSAILHRAA